MRRALITGAAGFLGRHAVALFNAEGIAVTALTPSEHDRVEADRVVVGDARDVTTVRKALRDADVVVHLAALPSPAAGSPHEVFCGNTAATFTVLEECAAAGVRHAVIASSQAISGRAFGPRDVPPAYLPIDETTPTHVADPYALSKATDEMTAATMWWRHGLAVRALRFPFLGDVGGRLDMRAAQLRADPMDGVRELWAYLDVRDAARACLLAARIPPAGTEIIMLAAPDTLCAIETEALLDKYLPNVPRRRRFAGHEVPLNLGRSRAILGFEASYLWEKQDQQSLRERP